MDIRLALMCGTDIPVPECQLVVHQPKIKEIALIGEQDFFMGAQTFCVNKKLFTQDKGILDNTNKEDVAKIPSSFIKFLVDNASEDGEYF